MCERDPSQNNTISLWIRFWSKERVPVLLLDLLLFFSSLTKNFPSPNEFSTFSSFDPQTFLFLKFRWVLEFFNEVFSHRLLLNGRSPLCVLLMWLFKLEDAEKRKLNWLHLNGFYPACFLIMCTSKLPAGTLCIFGMLFKLDGTNKSTQLLEIR